MFHWRWLFLPCILSPFLFLIIKGLFKLDHVLIFFQVFIFFYIDKLFSAKLLLGIAVFTEGLIISASSGIALNDMEPTNSRYILFVPDFCFSWR